MLDQLDHFDKQLFLFLNSQHNPTLDGVMSFLSHNFVFLTICILVCLYSIFKKYSLKAVLVGFMTLLLCFGASDLASTKGFKNTIKRPRPCYNKEIKPQVHSVGSCFGGRYGFVSSHASNTMALAVLIILMSIGYKKLLVTLIPYSMLVSYSRIYVGKHYPLDVICGMLLGALIGLCFYRIWKKINLKQRPNQL